MLKNDQVQCDNSTIKKLEFEFHSAGYLILLETAQAMKMCLVTLLISSRLGKHTFFYTAVMKPPNDQYKLDSVKSQTIG